MFIARFLFGLALPFAKAAALLISEIAYPNQRAQATSLIGPFAHFGSVLCVCPSFQYSKLLPNDRPLNTGHLGLW